MYTVPLSSCGYYPIRLAFTYLLCTRCSIYAKVGLGLKAALDDRIYATMNLTISSSARVGMQECYNMAKCYGINP